MEPIIVIIGFLGAGKTTLLKKLVTDYLKENWNPYIILNDYENANLDSQQFLEILNKNQINALNGSCICCSGVNELRQSVNDIPAREKGITIIEANGTTDACTLMGFLGVGLKDRFLPPIQISVVDARNWQQRGVNNELEANQIQISSLIVLNYADQVEDDRIREIKRSILKLNSFAIVKTWNDVDTLSLPELSPSINQAKAIEHFKTHWSSCSVDLPDPMTSKGLEHLLQELPQSILRVKACTRLDKDKHYSFIEKIATGEIFVRPYTGTLVSGPKILTIGPGSSPELLKRLINQEKNHETN